MRSSSPLDTCPLCGYSLRGLPTDHKCPECGLAYDPSLIVIRWKEESRARRAIGAAAFLVGLIAFSVAKMGWTAELRSFCKFVLVFLCIDVIWYLRGRGPLRVKDFVLTTQGLLIRDLACVRYFHPWREIQEARYRWWTGRLTIIGTDGRAILNAVARNGPSRRAARSLITEIIARLRQAISAPALVDLHLRSGPPR